MIAKRSLVSERLFCAAPAQELGAKLWERFESAQREQTPRAARWFAAYSAYYGDENEAGRTWGLSRRGEAGELAAVRINRARRASKARQQLILSGRVAFRAKCSKQDADAEEARLISQAWLEHDFKSNGMERLWRQGVEYSEFASEAYAFTEFDFTRGSDVQTTAGIRRDGDVRTTLLPPWMISTDNSVASPEDRNWWFVCTSRPKADLTMLYSRIRRGADWVQGDEAERAIFDARPFMVNNRLAWYGQRTDLDRSLEDNAEVVTFIHRPTLRFPLGRFIRLLGADCVLEDRPLIGEHGDYDETAFPLERLSADEMAGTPHAWTTFYDALANQELLDAIDTNCATIATSFGTPVYAIEKNSGNKPEHLVLGMRPWLLAPGGKKPELVERPQVSDSMMKYREALGEDLDKTFAINDDATGQTDSKDKNAQAEALRASMAVQQVSAQAGDARTFLRKVMECRLKTTRKNIQGQRLLQTVGEGERATLGRSKFFTAAKLEPLSNVELEESNPLEDTPQGRQALLDYYGERGLIKNQEDVESVMRIGRLSPALDPVRAENKLIEAENEMIQRGEVPHVYPTQNHVLHIAKHAITTYDVSALENGDLLDAQNEHEKQHWLQRFGCDRDTDPLFRPRWEFIMGRGPEPQAPIPPPATIAAGVPPQGPGAPQLNAGPPAPKALPPGPAQGPEAAASAQPTNGEPAVSLPKNPLNGQTFSPTQPPVEAPQ